MYVYILKQNIVTFGFASTCETVSFIVAVK